MIEINRKEALRYLGYRQSIEGDLTEINSALDHCIEVLQKTVAFTTSYCEKITSHNRESYNHNW